MNQPAPARAAGDPVAGLVDTPRQPPGLAEYRDAIRDSTRLTRLLAILAEPAPLPVLVDRVLLAISELFAADVVTLLEVSLQGELRPLGAIGLPEARAPVAFSGAEGSHAAAAVRSQAPVLVPDARHDPALDPCLRALDLAAAAWLPVLGSRGVVGLLVLARCLPLPFARGDVDLLTAMCHRIGLVLERARAEQARHELEVRLQQAEKSESLGRMAAAIAHHFNNKLSAVMESLDLARASLPAGHEALQEMAFAQEAARQAARVSGLMLTYLGQGADARDPLDLVATCQEVMAAATGVTSERVRLRVEWPPRGLPVRAHAGSVRQVLGNLLDNAFEALPEAGGDVAVVLREVTRAEVEASPLIATDGAPPAERYACLEVSDTGVGLERAAVSKIFDPFYTTKFAGRGLGLPVVLGIVRGHAGAISVSSSPGRGATFRVYLPLAPEAMLQVRPPPLGTAPAGARGLALVVDDEPLIRRATARLLGELGHQVVTASDGVEALELFRRRPGEFGLALLDVTMPKMGGWEALAALRALRPDLPVVLASGYDEARVMSGKHDERPQAFLQKPFDLAELEAAVAKALAAVGA